MDSLVYMFASALTPQLQVFIGYSNEANWAHRRLGRGGSRDELDVVRTSSLNSINAEERTEIWLESSWELGWRQSMVATATQGNIIMINKKTQNKSMAQEKTTVNVIH